MKNKVCADTIIGLVLQNSTKEDLKEYYHQLWKERQALQKSNSYIDDIRRLELSMLATWRAWESSKEVKNDK